MAGNVPLAVPPKCWEIKTRLMEKSLISSSMVIGKISNPILDSLVKTETLSRAFWSSFMLAYKYIDIRLPG